MVAAIHDPIHGTIEVSRQELALIDTRPFQRLRHIKQLGFAEMAFPGATHSRYAHSLGAMQMVTRMVDRLWDTLPVALSMQQRIRLRQAVRLAMLFHDLGHPPLSHVSERMMPPVSHLGLHPLWVGPGDPQRQATHEDFTLKLLCDSELGDRITRELANDGIDQTLLASLIAGRPLPAASAPADISAPSHLEVTWVDGIDLLPLLTALISGELDADRMDYLRRDAYSCGVSYGAFDHNWLCNNLTAINHDGRLSLGLMHRAVWAFENFLLARYHMFMAVYYHHTAICFDHLLGRFYSTGEYTLPGDTQGYLETDDAQLLMAMRASKSPWAKAVVQRKPWSMLLETHVFGDALHDDVLDDRLRKAGIDYFRVDSQGMLSKYFGSPDGVSALRVIEPELQRIRRIDEYTPLYRRFSERASISRVYCRPHDKAQALECVRDLPKP